MGILAVLVAGAAIGWGLMAQAPKPEPPSKPTTDIAVQPVIPLAAALVSIDLPTLPGSDLIRTGELEARDTLTDLLDRLGVPRSEANSALYSIFDAGLLDPRRLRPGLEVQAFLEPGGTQDAPQLAGLTVRTDPMRSITVNRTRDGQFHARELLTKTEVRHQRVSGVIEFNLYKAALDAGARDQQVVDFAQIFAYDIDFQRELRVGDEFEIFYEVITDERGKVLGQGDVIFAAFDGDALRREFYRYTPTDDGVTDYFDLNGESARKFLMKTPINGARLSSSFGMRRHPISGYSRLHKGTDFAAPSGTPVYAAGNGVVERASRYGGYGNYVRLRHANGYQTAYAHLSRYGNGIKSGRRVSQGDIIGYVGSTGASTGPHLHYEVIKNGDHVNAMALKLPTGRKLQDDELESFKATMQAIDDGRRAAVSELRYASAVVQGQGGAQ